MNQIFIYVEIGNYSLQNYVKKKVTKIFKRLILSCIIIFNNFI